MEGIYRIHKLLRCIRPDVFFELGPVTYFVLQFFSYKLEDKEGHYTHGKYENRIIPVDAFDRCVFVINENEKRELQELLKLTLDQVESSINFLQEAGIIYQTNFNGFRIKEEYRLFNICYDSRTYIEEHNNLVLNKPVKSKVSKRDGWVYLMNTIGSNLYKIGFSTKPTLREKTLSAEFPESKFVLIKKATQDFEFELHGLFESKRVRGEWFRLDDLDINYIKSEGFISYGEHIN